MSTDAVKRVRDSEADAKKIIDDANSKSKEIIESAKIDAKQAYDDLVSKAKENRVHILEKARVKGEKDSIPIIDEAKAQIDDLSNIDVNLASNAIKSVVERIVNNSGNS